jgi:hypothetical protein
MRTGPVTGIAFAAMICASAAAARSPLVIGVREYDCKVLARQQEFPNLTTGGPPQMNAWGQVAFFATPASGLYSQIRVGHGEQDGLGRPVTWRVADSDPAVSNVDSFSTPVIEDNGLVVFAGYDETIQQMPPALEAQGIFRIPYFQLLTGDGSPAVKNYGWDTGSPFLGDFSDVSTNSAGTLLFVFADQTLYVGGSSVAASGFTDEQIHPGARAFYAYLASLPAGGQGLYVDDALLDSADGNTSDVAALSVNGDAAPVVSLVRFDYSVAPTRWTIEVESSLAHQVYVDSAIDPVGSTSPTATSLNGHGEVAFSGMVANGSALWRVHCQNMPDLGVGAMSARAIDNAGQIAFVGSDPHTNAFEIVRADPLPGQTQRPSSCVGLSDGMPCDDGYPPAIATCQAGACVATASGLPSSCAGLPDYAPCDGSGAKMPAYCIQLSCVGRPVPEPEARALALAVGIVLIVLVRRRT